ncbi:hypothetical protein Ahy_B09g098556 [Arachis hypogaea]|uniref:FAR1 domain-containing protein n=1 Tax=Arachis hypogaea TaxID=3818 RepID=A0A444XS74_ARAHY|nr:hypothetical protein Ahy_B09g098556 [Arachis hypogaea]
MESEIGDDVPIVGMEFESMDVVIQFYNTYGRRVAFDWRNRSLKKNADGVVYYVMLICNWKGRAESKVDETKRTYPKGPTGCKVRMIASSDVDGSWIVRVVELEHCHDLNCTNLRLTGLAKLILKPAFEYIKYFRSCLIMLADLIALVFDNWTDFVNAYCLKDNKWLQRLLNDGIFYLKGGFWVGISSMCTQRSESYNNALMSRVKKEVAKDFDSLKKVVPCCSNNEIKHEFREKMNCIFLIQDEEITKSMRWSMM